MKNTIINAIIFAAGAAVGSLATWKLLEDKYKKIADEEIESVKDLYSEKMKNIDEENKELYKKVTDDLGYSDNDNESSNEENKEEFNDMEKPYVISPEEFGEDENYELSSLTYYSDGTLTDGYDNIIENVDFVVGKDFASHFGEYEDDSIFIKNDETQTYYEILKVKEQYSDVFHG